MHFRAHELNRRALFGGALLALFARPATLPADVDLIAFGDWGAGSLQQRTVARSIVGYLEKERVHPQAALLLGDNFYGPLPQAENDPRWQTEFEEMYPRAALAFPFYVALGNHDYEPGKAEAEFAYAKKNPLSRWKLPSKWYRVDFPGVSPLVTVFVVDSNRARLSPADWEAQLAWLRDELKSVDEKRWVILAAHHPVFTEGEHGDDVLLLRAFEPLLRSCKVDFYLCGHDHNMEHLEIPDWPPSFLLIGGGGAALRPIKSKARGPFAVSAAGFLHLHFTPKNATMNLVDAHARTMHSAERSVDGAVVEKTGDCPAMP